MRSGSRYWLPLEVLLLAPRLLAPLFELPPVALLVPVLLVPVLGALALAGLSALPEADEALEVASALPLSLLAEAVSEPASDLAEDGMGEPLRA